MPSLRETHPVLKLRPHRSAQDPRRRNPHLAYNHNKAYWEHETKKLLVHKGSAKGLHLSAALGAAAGARDLHDIARKTSTESSWTPCWRNAKFSPPSTPRARSIPPSWTNWTNDLGSYGWQWIGARATMSSIRRCLRWGFMVAGAWAEEGVVRMHGMEHPRRPDWCTNPLRYTPKIPRLQMRLQTPIRLRRPPQNLLVAHEALDAWNDVGQASWRLAVVPKRQSQIVGGSRLNGLPCCRSTSTRRLDFLQMFAWLLWLGQQIGLLAMHSHPGRGRPPVRWIRRRCQLARHDAQPSWAHCSSASLHNPDKPFVCHT